MKKELDKKIKKLDMFDMSFVKLSVAAATLFVIGIWPAAMNWVHSVNPWWFLAVMVVLGARPFYRAFIK